MTKISKYGTKTVKKDIDIADEKLTDVIKILQDILNGIPPELRDKASLDLNTDGWSQQCVSFEMHETKEEFEAGQKNIMIYNEGVRARELKQLKELQEKYNND